MRFLSEESGNVLVTSAMCVITIMGFVALATDVGLLWHAKRVLQTAADAGAMNGAAELIGQADWNNAALAATAMNGVTNGATSNAGTTTVNVYNPPIDGAYSGNSEYVEVVASQPQSTFFLSAFGYPSINVAARAVASNEPTTDCIITLGKNQTTATSPPGATGAGIAASGSGSISAPSCGISEDADESGDSAVSLSGSASITAKSLSTVGTVASAELSHITVTNPSTVSTGAAPVSDPLASIVSAPTRPTTLCSTTTYSSGTVPNTCYYSSLTISGTVNLNSGVYYIQGNLKIQGGANVTGTTTTFYVTCPPGNCTSASTENCSYACITISSSTLNLTAPTSGAYKNILFYQDSSDPETATLQGGSAGNVGGIIYLPSAGLVLSGGSGTTFNIDLITQWLNITGPSTITPYAPLDVPPTIAAPVLTE